MRQILDSDEFDFRYDIGVSDLSNNLQLTDCARVVQSLASHYVVVGVKAQLDQIVTGLSSLGVYDLIKANPRTMHKLLTLRPKLLTSDSMIDLFETKLSPVGSNRREDEELLVMFWMDYLGRIEGKQVLLLTHNYYVFNFQLNMET